MLIFLIYLSRHTFFMLLQVNKIDSYCRVCISCSHIMLLSNQSLYVQIMYVCILLLVFRLLLVIFIEMECSNPHVYSTWKYISGWLCEQRIRYTDQINFWVYSNELKISSSTPPYLFWHSSHIFLSSVIQRLDTSSSITHTSYCVVTFA